jgi:hypothetical protein
MKATSPWITYRTRFLVNAKQLNTTLSFTDSLGRVHSGRKGDYLVESSDGVLRIAPRQIFEDIYVPLLEPETPKQHDMPQHDAPQRKTPQPETPATVSLPPHLTRKSPQPYRDRTPAPTVRSL